MRITYDKQADAVYIYLTDKLRRSTKTLQMEWKDLCFVDMDWNIPIWVEILDASKVFWQWNIELLWIKESSKLFR